MGLDFSSFMVFPDCAHPTNALLYKCFYFLLHMLGVEQLSSYPPSRQPGIAYAHILHQPHAPKGPYHTFHLQKTQGRLNMSSRVWTFPAWKLWASNPSQSLDSPLCHLQTSKVALMSHSKPFSRHSCSQEGQSQLPYTYKLYQPSSPTAFPWLSNPTTSSVSMYSKLTFGNIPFKEVFGELYPC